MAPKVHILDHDSVIVVEYRGKVAIAKRYPAAVMTIRVRERSTWQRHKLLIPMRWWIDAPEQGYRVLLQGSSSSLRLPLCNLWPLGNSYDPGFVCWGRNPHPTSLDEADRLFFSTPFGAAYRTHAVRPIQLSGGLQAWADRGEIDLIQSIKRSLDDDYSDLI